PLWALLQCLIATSLIVQAPDAFPFPSEVGDGTPKITADRATRAAGPPRRRPRATLGAPFFAATGVTGEPRATRRYAAGRFGPRAAGIRLHLVGPSGGGGSRRVRAGDVGGPLARLRSG